MWSVKHIRTHSPFRLIFLSNSQTVEAEAWRKPWELSCSCLCSSSLSVQREHVSLVSYQDVTGNNCCLICVMAQLAVLRVHLFGSHVCQKDNAFPGGPNPSRETTHPNTQRGHRPLAITNCEYICGEFIQGFMHSCLFFFFCVCVCRLQSSREAHADQMSFSRKRDLHLLVGTRLRWGTAHHPRLVLSQGKVSDCSYTQYCVHFMWWIMYSFILPGAHKGRSAGFGFI